MNRIDIHRHVCNKANATYEAKNSDYGDGFSKVRADYPNAILIRLRDKLSRLETLMNGKRQMVNDESIKDTLLDLANYCLMELVEMEVDECGKACAAEIATGSATTSEEFEALKDAMAKEYSEALCKNRYLTDRCRSCQVGKNASIEQISCREYIEYFPEVAVEMLRKVVE